MSLLGSEDSRLAGPEACNITILNLPIPLSHWWKNWIGMFHAKINWAMVGFSGMFSSLRMVPFLPGVVLFRKTWDILLSYSLVSSIVYAKVEFVLSSKPLFWTSMLLFPVLFPSSYLELAKVWCDVWINKHMLTVVYEIRIHLKPWLLIFIWWQAPKLGFQLNVLINWH